MNQSELYEILGKHARWLRGESGGYSCRAIAAMMGCSFSTVSRLTN